MNSINFARPTVTDQIEANLIAEGFEPLQQPERARYVCWQWAEQGIKATNVTEDGRLLHPMPSVMVHKLNRLEAKRQRQTVS